MKIALFSPGNFKDPLKQAYGPTLGLAYLAGSIRETLGIRDISIEIDAEYMLAQKPDLIGISSYTEEFNRALEVINLIKAKTDIPVILGGHHLTALPETLPEKADLGVIGDGEEVFTDIVKLFSEGKLTEENYKNLSGIVFRNRNGELVNNGKRLSSKDLDFLPAPARDLFRAYNPQLRREMSWYHRLYTARGCPFSCIFCMYSKMRKRNMRYHSPERVISDIKDILKAAPQQQDIFIADDLFVIDKKRLYEIAALIRQEGLNKKLTFSCLARANIFDEEIALILRSMNITRVSFGFESGSDNVLRYLKGGVSVKHNQKAVDICEKYNIKTGAYLVTGSPVETTEDLAKSYWFISQNRYRLNEVSSFCIIPLPETQLWDHAVKEGFIDPQNMEWDRITYISLEKDKYIFMNQHYSLDDFKFAHSQYFGKFYEWCGFIDIMDKNLDKSYRPFKRKIFEDIISCNPSAQTLEIAPVAEILDFYNENIKFIHYKALNKLTENVKYETVILNNVMDSVKEEEFSEILNHLSQFCNGNTDIYIFINNLGNLANLQQLLSGTFNSNGFNFYHINPYRLYTREAALKLIEKAGLEIRAIKNYQLAPELESAFSKIMELFRNFIPTGLTDTSKLNSFGYLVHAGFHSKI